AATRRRGELFEPPPPGGAGLDLDAFRRLAACRCHDPEALDQWLDEGMADPALAGEVELQLAGEGGRVLRCYTAPLGGDAAGRLWTFLDITPGRRRTAERERLRGASVVAAGAARDLRNILTPACAELASVPDGVPEAF